MMNWNWGTGIDGEDIHQPEDTPIEEELDTDTDAEVEPEVVEQKVADADDGLIRIRYLDSGKIAKVTATVFGELRRRGRRVERIK